MRRIFYMLLFSLLASLFLSLIIMTVTFLFGYKRSLSELGYERRALIEDDVKRELEDIFIQGIQNHESVLKERLDPLLGPNISMAVYDSEKRVLYTHTRGHSKRGRRFNQDTFEDLPLKALRAKGRIIGYYSISPFGLGIDRATESFIESMRKTVILSLVFAIAIAFIFSLIISKRLSAPAKVVSDSINKIARGNLSVRIPKKGAMEISLIAQSANELAEKLEREESMRHQWASDIAHDLKTPIAALRSQLEGMADGVLDLTKERIGRNLKELSRIETLVNDLGELTRLESPEMHIELKNIDSETFFQELRDRFSRQFEEKKIEINWNKEVDSFKGDENLIQRAVSNFISNAIRHTPESGKISVGICSTEKGYKISVFNSGEIIPEQEIKKVFDRLYRGEFARKSPGSGLGLTIAQKIAELHGGKVTISSKEGYGTTVEMFLNIT